MPELVLLAHARVAVISLGCWWLQPAHAAGGFSTCCLLATGWLLCVCVCRCCKWIPVAPTASEFMFRCAAHQVLPMDEIMVDMGELCIAGHAMCLSVQLL